MLITVVAITDETLEHFQSIMGSFEKHNKEHAVKVAYTNH